MRVVSTIGRDSIDDGDYFKLQMEQGWNCHSIGSIFTKKEGLTDSGIHQTSMKDR